MEWGWVLASAASREALETLGGGDGEPEAPRPTTLASSFPLASSFRTGFARNAPCETLGRGLCRSSDGLMALDPWGGRGFLFVNSHDRGMERGGEVGRDRRAQTAR